MHFSLFFFLTVFSSPLKKTRVPSTAGNSANTDAQKEERIV